MPSLQPQHVQKIHELIDANQIIQAIQVYRSATGVSLAEAKQAVDEMRRMEAARPSSDSRDYDNPVLESKVKSLLAKGKKIEAVKIYREEYGIGLKEAKDAVDQIEATMPRASRGNTPYESAIGNDPFAQEDAGGGRVVLLLIAAVGVAVCGIAAAVFLLGIN
ncbi:MAG: 50S ribosomal protein L7/L12 [Anaerolineales bacterium]|nr:50S ribosomal protein L7/L12 [Anaerolineales bacterium]